MHLRLAACWVLLAGATASRVYDPCAPSSVSSGGGVALGLAYGAAGGGAEELLASKHPCLPAGSTALGSAGVVTAVFRPKVDEIAVMRAERSGLDALGAGHANRTLALVAYGVGAGGSPVASEPRVARTREGHLVRALTLIARFQDGNLKYLQWHPVGCGECGGNGAEKCASVELGSAADDGDRACVDLATECARGGDLADEPDRCHVAVSVAFAGTDKHSSPLQTGVQIESLNDYSLTSMYASTPDASSSVPDSVGR